MKKALIVFLAFIISFPLVVYGVIGGEPPIDEVTELKGAWIIDGYNVRAGDRSPQGTLYYDSRANEFVGLYVGLKLPADRPELHAWLYETTNKTALHLGRADYKPGTIGKDKGRFKIKVPDGFKGGNFRGFELFVFSAEARGSAPKFPSGSKINPKQDPAFYLFGRLPGSNSPLHFCGHGEDFFYAKNLDHTCYD